MNLSGKIYGLLAAALIVCFANIGMAQHSSASRYLFHLNPFRQVQPASPQQGRRTKVRLDLGAVFGFYKNDPHYTTGTQGNGAYTLGLKAEIPVLRNAAVLTGADFIKEGFNFDSYFFAKGYSFLYNGDFFYNHRIDIDELQVPLEYKINFSPETRNIKTFYATLGWMFRYIFYNNAIVTDNRNGKFVWEGQNDVTSVFHLFSPYGSSIIEAALGYQHNTLRSGNAFFFEVEYKYGISPLVYTGNNEGSNNIQFRLNTLSFKLGLRL